MAIKVKEIDLLVVPETCTVIRFEDIEGDPDGTGPYLYPVAEVTPEAAETAIRAGASVQRGYDAPYVGDPKAPIGDFCGYRKLRRAYTLDRAVAEILAELAEQASVIGDWPVFRGLRVHVGGYASQEQAAHVTVDYRRGTRNLSRPPDLGHSEISHATTFDWGYGGSRPAELARAILVAMYPTSALVRKPECYQLFRRQVIARLPHKEFCLNGSEVRAWFAEWLKSQWGHQRAAPAPPDSPPPSVSPASFS